MSEQISREQAQACLDAIKKQFKSYLADRCTCGEPLLQEPGVQCGGWAIVWECHSPYQWTYRAFKGGFDEEMYALALDASGSRDSARDLATDAGITCPEAVFTEPVNGCVLGLYPMYTDGR